MMDDDLEIFEKCLRKAEKKYPHFAEGQYQALGFLEEEIGELAKTITKQKNGWEEKCRKDALDIMVVAYRIYRGDWKTVDET